MTPFLLQELALRLAPQRRERGQQLLSQQVLTWAPLPTAPLLLHLQAVAGLQVELLEPK